MKSIVVNGKTIEEAINQGLSELGCAISACKVDTLQEGAKGLFGFFGSKPASVRQTLLAARAKRRRDQAVQPAESLPEPAA